ncbi:MAG: hypothetical protein ACLQL2_06830, partial [Methylovirgula sp.]
MLRDGPEARFDQFFCQKQRIPLSFPKKTAIFSVGKFLKAGEEARKSMCGIVGLFLKDASLESELGRHLSVMLETMTARGPDSAGFAV